MHCDMQSKELKQAPQQQDADDSTEVCRYALDCSVDQCCMAKQQKCLTFYWYWQASLDDNDEEVVTDITPSTVEVNSDCR